jgi:glycosyltransferase involved in cell wall biosynthesis
MHKPGKTRMILDLVAAMAALPADAVLVLVGDGPGRRRVEDETASRKPDGRVRVVGSVPHEDIKWFYAACDLFAYPYPLDRPFLAILEAQSCGRPVVTMHTRSAEITVQTGRTGLLAKDLGEFQAHMAALARDRTLCESMGRAAREYIAEFHSVQVRVKQIEAMLNGSI